MNEYPEMGPSLTYQRSRECLADGLAGQHRKYAQLSASAAMVQALSPMQVCGPLQTEQWARRVMSYAPAFGDDEQRVDVEAAVAERMARGEQLTAGATDFHLISTSFPLRFRARHWPWEVVADQFERLIHAALDTRFRFGLLPDAAPARMMPSPPVWIYDGRLVEYETYSGVLYLSGAEEAACALRAFRELADLALYGQDAAAELRRMRVELLGR
ncbi:Scr1 family TA system antitoxin-like transcriptional regulator [Catenulispora pinisilvae]|uniref:Scr1 family TA system antitoxin-like transcriptional regulator n=1 Tax=Catenulispora pinisilvae TaxID=2705253 RepID=UPI0018912A51|nr:Scr1 family TA system antitoxin-like transcriptional regulator [Catenulispora pinisilvae]